MPDWILPASFISLLEQFEGVFTKASFQNFQVIMAGWIHALGMHRVSDVLRAAGALASKHFCSYYRFFSHGRWSLDELGLLLLGGVLRLAKVKELELVLDDTLSRRKGKKVSLGMMHADPLLKYKGRPFHSYGHVFVVLAIHVTASKIAATGWALPILFRLFESGKQGGQKDALSDRKRAANRRRHGVEPRQRRRLTDRTVVGGEVVDCEPQLDTGPLPEALRPTKLQLAAHIVLLVAKRFPQVQFRVLADHLYNGRALIYEVLSEVDNVSFVVRGQPNAVLYGLPPARKKGQRGRPRVRGELLPNPEKWAVLHPRAFKPMVLAIYGKQVPVKVASYTGMAYRTLPGRLVQYVIVKDPHGIYRDAYLMSTDLSLSAEQVVEAFSHRWPLERTFQDCKQKLGMQEPQTQLPRSVRRTAPFAMLVYSLVVLWYITTGHQQSRQLRSYRDPWYEKKLGRPSFIDMLATLRRLGWARGFPDLARPRTLRSKFMIAYLARVAAAA
jgi:hypothetical protein